MQFFFIVLIISFVVFLFSLYTFAHDDFILLRRNISTDDVFNYAFISAILSLLFARIFYVVSNPAPVFYNPLGFLIFPYFPGLSFMGGVVGGTLALLFLSRRRGFPIGRIFDFFSIAFLSAMPFGFIGYMLLSKDRGPLVIFQLVAYLIVFFICATVVLPRLLKSGKGDGLIALIFMIVFSVITLIRNYFLSPQGFLVSPDNIFLFSLFIASIFLLVRLILGKPSLKQ